MRKVLSGFVSVASIVAILVGGPTLLMLVGRLDLLVTIDWRHVLVVPDDGSIVLLLLTIVGWVAWVLVAASLLGELIAVLTSGRVRLSVPGTRWFKPAAVALVAANVGLLVAAAQTAGPSHTATPSGGETSLPPAPPPPSASQTPAATPSASSAELPSHIVRPGDDLWTLATRYLGAGERWRDIVAVNDTQLLDPTADLPVDMVLHLPSDAVLLAPPGVEAPDAAAPAVADVVVVKGDSLWRIAQRELGDGLRWVELFEANRDRVVDPDVIEVGWQLRLPALPAATATTGPVIEASSGPVDASLDRVDQDQAATPGADVTELKQAGLAVAAPDLFSVDAELGKMLGTMGGGLAVGFGGALAWRRRKQLALRPLGRRILLPFGDAAEFEAALAKRATDETVHLSAASSVVVGWDEANEPVQVDLSAAGLTVFAGPPGDVVCALAALVVELASTGASEVITVGSGLEWLGALDQPAVESLKATANPVVDIERAVRVREGEASDLRLAPAPNDTFAQAGHSVVFVSEDALELGPELLDRMRSAGVSAVTGGAADAAPQVVQLTGSGTASVLPDGPTFQLQRIHPDAQRSLEELTEVTGSETTTPAPWWEGDAAAAIPLVAGAAETFRYEDSKLAQLQQERHPTLFLLGTVSLQNAHGRRPPRAEKQCEEYCAWIMTHPGGNSIAMTRALLVAETTRRSNMSRLRTWLGADEEGEMYLPEAYGGRIWLHPGVTSDWEFFQTLISAGVNRTSEENLRSALELVRGAPLADAAPGQWYWSEELRCDMASAIRDTGVVLGERLLEAGDIDGARWAAARALQAAPGDELLLLLRIKTENRAGNHPAVERLVMQVTRQARALGVDLSESTVHLLQEVMATPARARAPRRGTVRGAT